MRSPANQGRCVIRFEAGGENQPLVCCCCSYRAACYFACQNSLRLTNSIRNVLAHQSACPDGTEIERSTDRHCTSPSNNRNIQNLHRVLLSMCRYSRSVQHLGKLNPGTRPRNPEASELSPGQEVRPIVLATNKPRPQYMPRHKGTR